MRITTDALDALNERFAHAEPIEILRFVHSTFGSRSAILSGMQRAGSLLCRFADRDALDFDVLFVDSGVMHRETLVTRDELARTHTHLRIITRFPFRSFAEQTAEEGLLYMTHEGQERCCSMRKREPLLAQKGRYDALVSALRREEGGARSKTRMFDIDTEMNALRVHPLVHISREALDAMIASDPHIVVNPLHAMGYPTIGCFTCTTPVLPNEPERAGRWRHLASVEYCGINPVDRNARNEGIEMDDRYASALFGELVVSP
jgi:phosphoadenosine phosphosulfate reductase